jgi:putative sterol carrier protein
MDAGELNAQAVETEVPPIDPGEFAALVREASDDQLARGFATNRDQILREVFRRMPERFNAARAAGVDAVVEWRILERPGGGHDSFHIVIRDGACSLERQIAQAPAVTYEIAPVDFVKLITGNASGPKLFLFGRLKVRGNLLLAARMQAYFSIPGA